MRRLFLCSLALAACTETAPELTVQCRTADLQCACEVRASDDPYESCPVPTAPAWYCCAHPSFPAAGDCYCRPLWCWSDASGGYCQVEPPDGAHSLADRCPAAGAACLLSDSSCGCGAACAGQPTIAACGMATFGEDLDLCWESGRMHVAWCN